MSDNSHIQWTDATWNPVLGCSKISPGCRGCYAINHVHRMAGNPNAKIAEANEGLTIIEGGHPNWTGKVRLIPERLDIPLRKRKPTRYFVNSLSDLFHEGLPDEDIDRVFATMQHAYSRGHIFQVLTKRSERMKNYFATDGLYRKWLDAVNHIRVRWAGLPIVPMSDPARFPLPRVWLGVSVESRAYLYRIDNLRKTPAAVRFLSLEPLLEDLGQLDLTDIDWVIVGGESGPGARPMHPDWVRSIRDQCLQAGVRFFFKQWGEYLPVGQVLADYGKVLGATAVKPNRMKLHYGGKVGQVPMHAFAERGVPVAWTDDGRLTFRVGKKAAGRMLDGRTWDDFPEIRQL